MRIQTFAAILRAICPHSQTERGVIISRGTMLVSLQYAARRALPIHFAIGPNSSTVIDASR